jgi:hypothetical protein
MQFRNASPNLAANRYCLDEKPNAPIGAEPRDDLFSYDGNA